MKRISNNNHIVIAGLIGLAALVNGCLPGSPTLSSPPTAQSRSMPQANVTPVGYTLQSTCRGSNEGLRNAEFLRKALEGDFGPLIYRGNTSGAPDVGIVLLEVPFNGTNIEFMVYSPGNLIQSAAIKSHDLDCRGPTSPRFIIDPLNNETKQLIDEISADYLSGNKTRQVNMGLMKRFLQYSELKEF